MTTRITFPISRLIGGSVSKLLPRTESDGKTQKIGRDGKPMEQINFGIAIAKDASGDWRTTAWGRQIFEIAKAAYPVLHQTASFSWKIIDGDSAVPNKAGKAPNAQQGYKGNWIIWFGQGWAPKLVNADGTQVISADQFKPGYYVQVMGETSSNGAQPPNTPGLYMNPVAVALSGAGELIASEVDIASAGFGGALPAGASVLPSVVEGFTPTAQVAAPAVPAPVVSVPVVPSAAFMQIPVAPTAPVRVMLPAAQGATYDAMIAGGWNDALLVQHGMMQA